MNTPMTNLWRTVLWTLLLCGAMASHPQARADSGRRVQAYSLESIEVRGTERVDASLMVELVDLKLGMPLNDTVVMTTRERVLSLGLFRSAVLFMRKGTTKGKAKLVIEVEDDPFVMTSWALGGDIGVTHGEAQAASADPDSPPLGYRFRLVSRNMFRRLYRGDAFVDVDGQGDIRGVRLTMGMPRFALEDAQFDVELSAIDITRRYLDASLFANRVHTVWTSRAGNQRELQYGLSALINRQDRFGFPNFPKLLTGPRLSYNRETRLKRFFPTAGVRTNIAAMYTPTEPDHSVLELGASRTWDVFGSGWLGLEANALVVGRHGVGSRWEARMDWPIVSTRSATDQAALFISLKSGSDRYKEHEYSGSAGLFGMRYHSSGFIAELTLQITKSPQEFLEEDLPGIRQGDL